MAPSANSTMECTTDCGCTSTSISLSRESEQPCASMTSKPLLTMVDESTVIFAPMLQLG